MSEADFWDYATVRSIAVRLQGYRESEKAGQRQAWERTRILAYLQVDKKGRAKLEKVFSSILDDEPGGSQEELTPGQLAEKMKQSARIGHKIERLLNGTRRT